MSAAKGIVLDANILLRAVFGNRVLEILSAYADEVNFYSPDVCFADAREYVDKLSVRRGLDPLAALAVLDGIAGLVEIVDRNCTKTTNNWLASGCGAATPMIGPSLQ